MKFSLFAGRISFDFVSRLVFLSHENELMSLVKCMYKVGLYLLLIWTKIAVE